MCKAVVVVDLPEGYNAEDCVVEVKVKHDNVVMSKYETNLRPLPEKKDYPEFDAQGYSEYEAQYCDGYNDCVDMITGERD